MTERAQALKDCLIRIVDGAVQGDELLSPDVVREVLQGESGNLATLSKPRLRALVREFKTLLEQIP